MILYFSQSSKATSTLHNMNHSKGEDHWHFQVWSIAKVHEDGLIYNLVTSNSTLRAFGDAQSEPKEITTRNDIIFSFDSPLNRKWQAQQDKMVSWDPRLLYLVHDVLLTCT